MKAFRRSLVIILIAILIVVSAGFLLPRKVSVERSLVINSSQQNLFLLVNNLRNMAKWSPWMLEYPLVKITISEQGSGPGAELKWKSENSNVGNGSILVLDTEPNHAIQMLMDFGTRGKSLSKFQFSSLEHSTKVNWIFESDLGINPVSRWFGMLSDRMIGPDLEKGLSYLNLLVEEQKSRNGFEIVFNEVPARIVVSVRDTASPSTIAVKTQEMYNQVFQFLKSQGLSPTGVPLAFFHSFANPDFDIEAGIPVSSIIPVPEGLICREYDTVKTVMVTFFGKDENIGLAYKALQNSILDKGLTIIGPPWEEYITNPSLENDTGKWQTNIYYPVK